MRHVVHLLVVMLTLTAASAEMAALDDLDVARQALRDGLWEVARLHAGKNSSETARLIILESYAQEGKWSEVRSAMSEWGEDSHAPAFEYYRAVVDGRLDDALNILKANGSVAGAAEAKMLEADLLSKRNQAEDARRLWHEVIAMTNAGERAFAVAGMNLGDVGVLRIAYDKVQSLPLKRMVGLRLGMKLVESANTMEEGAKLIRMIVADSPDADGACDAFVALAEAEASAGHWKESESIYRDAIEIWPVAVRLAAVQLGRGESLMHLGSFKDALAAFAEAENLSSDNSDRALSMMKQGDALSSLGRGEEAMAKYKETIAKYPSTAIAEKLNKVVELCELEAKGRALYKDYRFDEAKAVFSEIAKSDPSRRSRMDYLDVLCLYGLGRDDEAVRKAGLIAQSCQDREIRADATLWLAKFMYNRGEWKRAGSLFRAFVDMSPSHPASPEALLWAARAAFAENDFGEAVQLATDLVERYSGSMAVASALLVQGEALVEQARFDEAVLVLERVSISDSATKNERFRAQLLKADCLFAMGADNPVRYQAALEAYRAVSFGGNVSHDEQIVVAFKIGRVLEKLKRRDEAIDQYYTRVVLAYRDGRLRGEWYGDEARASFSRASFRLADDFENRGLDRQAMDVLMLVVESDVPAAKEAERRIERISRKGRFL